MRLAYMEVAEQLAPMRQYPRAAAMYQIAVHDAPWWSAARNALGLLYTQSGDEAQSPARFSKRLIRSIRTTTARPTISACWI